MQNEYCVEINRKNRIKCVEPGCNKGAIYRYDKCSAHGGGKRCVEPGCNKGALSKSDKCGAHGGGPRCVETGCNKGSIRKTNKCSAHGGGPRCAVTGCNKGAILNTDKCAAHGGGNRCIETGCNKGAIGKSDKCVAHGGGTYCIEAGCNKSTQGKTDKCIAHGGGVRCIKSGCNKSAISKNDKCMAHGGGARCPNCINWIDSRCGSIKYDGYCATCFKRCFPYDARSQVVYAHTKEIMVRNKINSIFDGFTHDRPLYTGNCDCTHRRRIDHRKLIGNTILAIETDEFGHRGYDKNDEEIRYDDLYMIHSGKWIFIRFNPDSNVSNVDIDDKLDTLIATMEECIDRIERDENTELVEIIKMYC